MKLSNTVKAICILFFIAVGAWAWHISPVFFFIMLYAYIGDMLKDYIHWSVDGGWGRKFLVHIFWPIWGIAFIVVSAYRGVKAQWKR